MNCPELPHFDLDDPASVENAFAAAPTLALRQSWLPAPQPDFRAGTIRIGCRAHHLLILARLEDDHIVTTATHRNDPLFQLGDTLEIFVGATGSPGYLEYHYAPNGTILQLRWPRPARTIDIPAAGGLPAFAIEENDSQHRIRPIPRGWEILAAIDLRHLPENPASRLLDLNIARYDHHPVLRHDHHPAVTPPTLSSTAPLPAPDFHARPHWHPLTLSLPTA